MWIEYMRKECFFDRGRDRIDRRKSNYIYLIFFMLRNNCKFILTILCDLIIDFRFFVIFLCFNLENCIFILIKV